MSPPGPLLPEGLEPVLRKPRPQSYSHTELCPIPRRMSDHGSQEAAWATGTHPFTPSFGCELWF